MHDPTVIPDWALLPVGVLIYGFWLVLELREHRRKMRRIRAAFAIEDEDHVIDAKLFKLGWTPEERAEFIASWREHRSR